jgi:SNF2 family DNA or RNA helicase
MGLGKTVQTLAFLSLLPPGSPILIIMPTSLKFNWQKEIERFLPQRAMDITSVSFHELRAQPEVYLKTFWEAVIVDEAQAIKNRATQTFKAAAALKSRFRLSISGTPIENRLEELLTHFEFLQPDLELPDDPRMLKKWVAPFMLRRNKSTVLKELPEKIESTVEVELFAEEKEIYDRFLSEAKEQGWDSQNPIQILEVILRLRQLACHPRLAGFPIENSSKMKLVVSDLESLVGEGRKTLVFSQFTSFLSLVGKELDALQIPYLTFTGETKDREGVVTAFQSEAGAQVMLMSLKAGGVGLNLTAADTVLILDPWWNQAAEEQAISRAHRIGQKQTLFVKRYLSRGTIEEKVALLKAHKKSLADEVIGEAIEDNGSVLEELLRLL